MPENFADNSIPANLPIVRYNQFLEMLLSGRPLESLLHELVLLIQEKQPECTASIMLISDDGKHLHIGASTDLPDYFLSAIDGIDVRDGVGSCGTAAARAQLVIVEDIQHDPRWSPYRGLAQQAGLRACWSQPIMNANGKVLGTFGLYYREVRFPSGRDLLLIHEAARLAQASIEFRRAENHRVLSETITQHLPLGLMITDADFNMLDVNPAFCAITGFKAEELLGKKPDILVQDLKLLRQFGTILQRLPAQKSWTTEIPVQRRNGERFNAELCFSAVRNEHNQVERCIGLISDITDRKRSEETIQYQANYDLLTSLPNRNLFYSRLNWMLEQCRRKDCHFSVMLMDLDYFKEINDTMGHDAGDELLAKIGARLQNAIGSKDTVARLGGDEFGFLIAGTHDREALENIAIRLHSAVGESLCIRQMRDLKMSSSLGISRFPEDGNTLEGLLKAAEQALYSAKNAGRDGFAFFTPAMHEEAETQAMLHQEMRFAVSDNQLELHYQPIKHLDSGNITHVEALIRWHNPQRGLVRPDLFIPLAEKTGLIREIGHWVREEALAMINRMQQYGIQLSVAVNISTAEFYDRELANKIVRQVQDAGVPRGSLMVEITESLLIRNQQETLNFLQTLQAAGIRVALDDFGTGFSSLSYLAAFPADKLKIDRSFVHQMSSDSRKQALVDTIITLGHSLNMTIIAEGVEEEADEILLRARACDSIQGYFLARPMTETMLLNFLLDYPDDIREPARHNPLPVTPSAT